MPRYRITAPDGRSVTVEGAQAPTEKDIAAIFAQVPQQPAQAPAQPDNYSALDKAKYMLRAAGEGATLGLGDLVAGQADVLASDVAGITQADNWKDRAKATTDLAVHALVPAASLLSDRFNKGRNAFIREQQAFAQAHPVLNFTGEMGGGLVTGIVGAGKKLATTAGKQGLKALAGEGAREGAKFGTAYGAGSGLTEEQNKLSIADALKGAGSGLVGGAVLGAALPVGIAGVAKGVKGISGALRKAGQILDADAMGAAVPQATAKQAPQIYVNEWGDIVTPKALQRLLETDENAVQQAVKEGVPLLDLADQKMLGTASGVRLASPEAEQIFTTYGRERLAGQHPKIVTALKQYFGNKGSHQLLDELNADVQKGAKVLYDKAVYQVDKAGNVLYDNAGKPLGKVLPELEKLNKYELDYVGKVYGTKGLEYEVQGLPQNDMRILNYAKQLMDDDIQRLTNQGHNNQARILAEKRAAFIEKIDKANPEYKTARSFFERGKRAETALQEGKKALKGERSNLEYDFNRLTPEEQAFYRKGVGNALEEMSNMQASGGNPAHKVFGEETLRRLKQLGIKDMDKLEKFARAESKASSNIQRLLQGSPTAEREMQAAREVGGELNVGGAIVNPKRTFKRSVANTINKQVKKIINDTSAQDRIEIARLLTDPEYLAKQVNEVNRLRGAQRANLERIRAGQVANSVKQAIQGEQKPSGSVLNALANKIKEEKGFVANPLSEGKSVKQALEYINEPFAKNPESVKNFQKWSDNAPFVGTNEEAIKDPFKTGKKVVVKAYHGTQRADRIGNVFREDRATSGPMPMFSSSEEIAQGYMKNKTDTSIRANEDISYENWFRIKNKGKEVKLDDAWYQLSPKQRETIAQNAPHITQDYQAENIVYDPNNWSGIGGYKEHLREANGNHLKALVDEWLNSGTLYDSEEQFVEVLKKAGLKDSQFVYDNPNAIKGDVFNTYIQFKKPLVTTDIPPKVMTRLEEVAKTQPIPDTRFGVDLWDKNTRHPIEWINALKEDYKNGKNSFAWSSIPDWVTNVLKDFGYDGIIDTGGKGDLSKLHKVYIPFKSNQIKSVNNRGTFSKRSPNIYKSLIGGLGISQILRNKENK